ncbi:hypothetical protein Psed_5057 [Pseudonocardia dioxanivorans CB1190]|uniref:Carbon monoxide dehydrogenase subunit G n=1 Tax=Pseudonocardia dioxanivorans (strain ATCC 55486 / DSM 44775 / JCM 13855 / CB1190) TaxID=675635 RepID=F4CPZ9_PSEUX|nr:hypothetical protein [Pseudonocardia dioxanivorans]AEA27195.1 hypothetical protein Psed_5057 [Pseudonocardia dioxanivorans CB1190]
MARLIDTLEVEAPVDTCFARLTAPPAPPRPLVLGLGGQRVEYRDATLRVVSSDPARRRVVLRAGDGDGRVSATIAAALRPGTAGTTIDVVTDLVVTGEGADVARALLPSLARRVLSDLTSSAATPPPPAATPSTATPSTAAPSAAAIPALQAPTAPAAAPRTRRRPALLVAAAVALAAAAAAAVATRPR